MPKNPYIAVSIHIPEGLKNQIENEAIIAQISPGELYRNLMFLGLASWAEIQTKSKVLEKVRKGLQ